MLALAAPFVGVVAALNRDDAFETHQAWLPLGIGLIAGLAIAGFVVWLYRARRWRPNPSARFLSASAAAGIGAIVLAGAGELIVGVMAACGGVLLPLMIWGGRESRRGPNTTE
jgi:hypothetical protein